MRIVLSSIGKDKEGDTLANIRNFTERISHYYPVEWKIISSPKNRTGLPVKALKAKEAVSLLESIKKDDFLVALDEKGKMFSSTELASWIQARANESIRQLVFLIGGAYGLDDSVLKRANFIWSLSPLTFPHQLVRLILSEQIYRACTIIKNEKYHHA